MTDDSEDWRRGDRRNVRFADLDPEVQDWFLTLHGPQVRTIKKAMEFYSSATTVGKFLRWVAIVFAVTFGVFGGLAAFGDHIASLWKVFLGAPK